MSRIMPLFVSLPIDYAREQFASDKCDRHNSRSQADLNRRLPSGAYTFTYNWLLNRASAFTTFYVISVIA